MKTSYTKLGLLILIFFGVLAQAESSSSSPENNLDEIRKFCVRDKKPKEVCGCLAKNLANKFRHGQFGEKQVSDALAAAKHLPDAPDYVADLMTGIEFHCMENSNYSE